MWIEIAPELSIRNVRRSLPSRECGLKSKFLCIDPLINPVTPFAGVWIEITWNALMKYLLIVTPFAGVWIEILILLVILSS